MTQILKCRKCQNEFDDRDLQEHHIKPKSIGGIDKNGRVYLCKKCHAIVTGTLLKIAYNSVDSENKKKIIQAIFKYSNEVFK